jgi:dTDP-glucose 4,6-dehydratase
MKILVTGGAGFIGSNFVRRTLATMPTVSITVLDSLTYAGRLTNLANLVDDIGSPLGDGSARPPHTNRYALQVGDIRNPHIVDALVSSHDLVVNFAAESHNDNSLKSPKPFIDTNITGTFELLQACVKYDVRFHHVSTDEVFGDLPLDTQDKFDSQTPYNPSSPYSASKAASDHLVRAWVRSFGLRATISNCSNNFGPYQHEEKLIPRTILLAAAGIRPKVYGAGSNVRDWIHVDDHNDGIWAVLNNGSIGQTYLLGADNQRSNLQVVSKILELMGKSGDFIEFVPDRPGHDRRYAIDASDSMAELSWRPSLKGFEAQLPQVIDFYLSQNVDIERISKPGLSVSI